MSEISDHEVDSDPTNSDTDCIHAAVYNIGSVGQASSRNNNADWIKGGARGVMIIIVENGHGNTSSNPG